MNDVIEKNINDEIIQDEHETSNRTIKSKNSDLNSKGIYYTKTKEISFPVTKISFSNIPVYKGVQLSFWVNPSFCVNLKFSSKMMI